MKNEAAKNDLPVYLFHQGANIRAHDFLGCHCDRTAERTVFRVWAPHALEISAIGDWNGWDESAAPMRRISDEGVWECAVDGVHWGSRYKFSVLGSDQTRRLKGDPFAFHVEANENKASVV